ncbi:MAG: hypothetical protein EOP09_05840 [Proteobacteria bacterium]|nr:MAG: hypothetical protein EOP09_05840 [Pseudomonadota bacterium]
MRISSKIDRGSETFRQNHAFHLGLVQKMEALAADVALGGGAETQAKLRKQGKLPARERIEKLKVSIATRPGNDFRRRYGGFPNG